MTECFLNKNIVVLGPGRVGFSIILAAVKSGLKISAVGARNVDLAEEAIEKNALDVPCMDMLSAASMGDIVLLTVSDSAIESVCRNISAKNGFKKGAIVLHTSGAMTSDELASARDDCGCKVASFHPLLSFSSPEISSRKLPDSYFFSEGDSEAIKFCEFFCKKIGAKHSKIEKNAKNLYHASAVSASNYLVTLVEYVTRMFQVAGLDPAVADKAVPVLIESTLDNISQLGPIEALTGPIERGDAVTVEKHLEAIESRSPELLEMYRFMAAQTISLAVRKGSIDENAASKLRAILSYEQ